MQKIKAKLLYKQRGVSVYEGEDKKNYFVDNRRRSQAQGIDGITYDRYPTKPGAKLMNVEIETA